MDQLRAQMLTQGYPVAGLSQRDNEVVWKSLVARTRRPQLMTLTTLTDAAIDAAIKAVRKQRQASGRK